MTDCWDPEIISPKSSLNLPSVPFLVSAYIQKVHHTVYHLEYTLFFKVIVHFLFYFLFNVEK